MKLFSQVSLFSMFILAGSDVSAQWTHGLASAGSPQVNNNIDYSGTCPGNTGYECHLYQETLQMGQVVQVTIAEDDSGTSDSAGALSGSYLLSESDTFSSWNTTPLYRYRSDLLQTGNSQVKKQAYISF